jgi:hypothetical protein
MPQLTHQDQSGLPAFEGGLYDSANNDVISRTPGANVKQQETITTTTIIAAVAQVASLTLTTAADGDAYTIIVGEFIFTGTSAGTDSTVQATTIRAQMNADTDFIAQYTVSGATNVVIVTADRLGVPFGMYAEVESTSAWTWADTTPAVVGSHYNLTVGGYQLVYPAESATEATESAAFLALVQADDNISSLIVATAPTGTTILIEALTAGVPVTIVFANENEVGTAGSGDLTSAATTANSTGNPIPMGRGLARSAAGDNIATLPTVTAFVFEGISIMRAKGRPRDNSTSPPTTGDVSYRAAEVVPVLRKGRIWILVEDAVTPASGVFVRHTQGANALHTPGRFRGADVSAEVDEITQGARWLTSADAGALAVLSIDVLAVVSS